MTRLSLQRGLIVAIGALRVKQLSVHVTEEKKVLENPTECNESVMVGGKEMKKATLEGSVRIALNNNTIKLKKVLYVPNFGRNILSINKILDNGGEIKGKEISFK